MMPKIYNDNLKFLTLKTKDTERSFETLLKGFVKLKVVVVVLD